VFADGEFSLELHSVEIEVPSAVAPTRTLVDVLWVDFSVVGEVQRNFLVESVDEEVKSWSSWISLSACCWCLDTSSAKQTF